MYNYGKCEICDTPLQERTIQQDFWIKDKLVVIENVPAGVCPQCGEKVVGAEVGEHIDELLKDTKHINKSPYYIRATYKVRSSNWGGLNLFLTHSRYQSIYGLCVLCG